MKLPAKISESEWEVMNLIWTKSPLSASDVVDSLAARNDWHPRTIRTLLDRLVKKGALKIEEDGKRYLYSPRISLDDCVRKESQNFMERVFGGQPASMLINLVKHSRLTPGEIKELKRILSEKEK
jgi:BlaI family penicillinase repressor